jgi:hypothetical protein
MRFTGTIGSFAMSGVEFKRCTFDHVTFVNCEFDAESNFDNCTFIGGSGSIRGSGLGEASFLGNTSFDPDAQKWIDQVRISAGKRKYTEQDLRSDLGIVLERFISKGRFMLRSVQKSNLLRGAIRSSKYSTEIVDEFRRILLEEHHVSGVSEPGFNIRGEYREDIVFFGQNNSFTGGVNIVFQNLREKLCLGK